MEITTDKFAEQGLPLEVSSSGPRVIITSTLVEWTTRKTVWRPPTDVVETKDEVIVLVEIAGMQNAEINISLDGRILAVRGVRPARPEHGAYHQMEINSGEFISSVELPSKVDVHNGTANYKDGFLNIRLPKVK